MMMNFYKEARIWKSRLCGDFVPILSPLSKGVVMVQSPGVIFSLLGLASSKAPKKTVPTERQVDDQPEEIPIYVDDNIELVIRNWYPVSFEEEIDPREVDKMGEYFSQLLVRGAVT